MPILLRALFIALMLLPAATTLGYAKTTVTKITWGQMVDACGSNNQSGGGHVGCALICSDGKSICDYDCKGTGHCTKTVSSIVAGGPRQNAGAGGGVATQSRGDGDGYRFPPDPQNLATTFSSPGPVRPLKPR